MHAPTKGRFVLADNFQAKSNAWVGPFLAYQNMKKTLVVGLPEPSTYALGILGAAALFFRRCK